MTYPEKPASAELKARETLERMASTLADAAAAVEGDASKSLLEVFPEPTERRTDTEFSLPQDREQMFRNSMAQLGIGRESNRGPLEVGLREGYVAVVEGGLAHKIAAELSTVLSDKNVLPSTIFLAATPYRKLPPAETDKAKERLIASRVLGIDINKVADDEFAVAKQVVEAVTDYRPYLHHSNPLNSLAPKGHDLRKDPALFTETGYIQVGEQEISVIMMRLSREDLGEGRYKQPGATEVMSIVNGLLELSGADTDIGFVTSSTYQPSREVDAISSMLRIERFGNNRHIGVITYGTAELAEVKQEQIPQPVALGQLAGEAHKTVQQLAILRHLIAEANPA